MTTQQQKALRLVADALRSLARAAEAIAEDDQQLAAPALPQAIVPTDMDRAAAAADLRRAGLRPQRR